MERGTDGTTRYNGKVQKIRKLIQDLVQKKRFERYKTDEKEFGMRYRKEQQKGTEKKGNNSGRGTEMKNGKV